MALECSTFSKLNYSEAIFAYGAHVLWNSLLNSTSMNSRWPRWNCCGQIVRSLRAQSEEARLG